MNNQARAVIIGSGIAGSSIAYHLTRLGWRDVVVLDQGPLLQGTTSHAPGLVGQLRSSVTLTKLLMYSVSLYKGLQVEGVPGYVQVGSLRLASSKERMQELKRQAGFAKAVGLEAGLIGTSEALRLFPLMSSMDIEGALYLPTDGSARASILAQALSEEARGHGASFHPETQVIGFEVRQKRVFAVLTTQGRIATDVVVAATGIWSQGTGRMARVSVPLVPMQHQYVMTRPLPELLGRLALPNVRDPDLRVYVRQDGDCMVLGGYEADPAPFDVDAIPMNANPTLRAFDAARFDGLLAAGRKRFPLFCAASFSREVNGLESFTPDGEFIVGESPEVRGFWVGCGFCAHGVSGAGGIGRLLAEWIVEGQPSLDTWHMDIRRFGSHATSRTYTVQRSKETYSAYYDVSYPGTDRASARNLRLSPSYNRLKELGAVFGEKNGWERPNWFASNEKLAEGQAWPEPAGWAARSWSPAIGAEHQATRERVALFDETSFSKIEVLGPSALSFLEKMTTNRMNRPVGSITYTQLLNPRGGIECDLTVTRLDEDRFQIITGTAFGAHDLSWIQSHLPQDGSVHARDITSSLCCLGVWGPKARGLMQTVSDDNFSNAAFPYMTARRVTVGEIPVLVCRVTYVGELGWELYAPMEYGLKLWDTLWAAGMPLGLVAGGYRAIDSLRLEKGYRYWSADIDPEHDPFEAGLRFSVKLDKGDFLGREALLQKRDQALPRKLCAMVLQNPTALALGGEPILNGERCIGRITSGGYGYTLRQSIAYGYLPIEFAAPGTGIQVELFGELQNATVVKEPLFDPQNEKVKG